MADHPRFGPAGVPHLFRLMGANLQDVPKMLKAEELDAFEYAAVRWGQVPQIKMEDAERLGAEAKANDVLVSMHGSYFINLLGEREVVEASKRRLIACALGAKWMGAYVVVFHPGFYGANSKTEAFVRVKKAVEEVVATLRGLGVTGVKLGPETMGRISQFGTLEETIALCSQIEGTQLVIDWSHLHARDRGRFKTASDFRMVAQQVERELGTEALRNMHCHFSKIEFTDKGEKRHCVLDEKGYGPEFEQLAEVVAEFQMHPVFVCETMVQDVDAMKMRKILHQITAAGKPL